MLSHQCIRVRTGRGQIYRWEFDRGEDHRVVDAPATKLVHSVSLDLDAPARRAVLQRASLTIPSDQVVAYLDRGGKSPRP